MKPLYHLLVEDKHQWRRLYPISNAIIYLGSDEQLNHVFLNPDQGKGVDASHAQIITTPDTGECRLINLGQTSILYGQSLVQHLTPNQDCLLSTGDLFKIGEFTITYQTEGGDFTTGTGGAVSTQANSSPRIGVQLRFPRTVLQAGQHLDGVLVIHNQGDDRAQFAVDLEADGLPADCYDVESGPVLPAGVTREVSFRLFHHGNRPAADDYTLVFQVTAPQTYRAEEATVTLKVRFLPHHVHSLILIPPGGKKPEKKKVETRPEGASSTPTALTKPLKPLPARKPEPAKPEPVWPKPAQAISPAARQRNGNRESVARQLQPASKPTPNPATQPKSPAAPTVTPTASPTKQKASLTARPKPNEPQPTPEPAKSGPVSIPAQPAIPSEKPEEPVTPPAPAGATESANSRSDTPVLKVTAKPAAAKPAVEKEPSKESPSEETTQPTGAWGTPNNTMTNAANAQSVLRIGAKQPPSATPAEASPSDEEQPDDPKPAEDTST